MTIFDDGAEVLFEIWPEAEEAIFVPLSGARVTGFNVVIDKSLKNLPDGYDVQAWGDVVELQYLLDQVGREAKIDEKFIVGTRTYKVVNLMENDGRFVRVLAR